MADYFTMLTKTESGLTVFLVPRHSPGLNVRVMPTQFDTSQGTTFLTMDDVKVPASNMVGEEGMGFSCTPLICVASVAKTTPFMRLT